MAAHLLLMEEARNPAEESFKSVLRDDLGFQCDYIDWNELHPQDPLPPEADLIVLVAITQPSHVRIWRDYMQASGETRPTLAVLPAGADAEALRMATRWADDFLLWPSEASELDQRVNRLLATTRELDAACDGLRKELTLLKIVGQDPEFVRILTSLPRIAASDCFVMITGETGTGKELIARAIHQLGKRPAFPFIPVDCAALPDTLLLNELFGHAPGAFTDARNHQPGLVTMADKGTLFLDEVDALSPGAQAMLLRFLQDRSYKRLGEARLCKADVNVISASNRNIEALVSERAFRSDLFFRLSVVRLELPPLRHRRGDIKRLAVHHLKSLSPSLGRKTLSSAAFLKLARHDWPGNVRELFNTIQRACVFCEGNVILPDHIQITGSGAEPSESVSFTEGRAQAIAHFERTYVEEMLRKHGGNVTRAAREAGKERRAFGRLVKKYGIG
ncbi:MAG: sigma-54-dependent Fis family transcriptional regulator [Acidobacteria bacterium]|nr:MAG: sigma-54-dependent Fis family transcriptional regulator [Acidobacteriota bacterium]